MDELEKRVAWLIVELLGESFFEGWFQGLLFDDFPGRGRCVDGLTGKLISLSDSRPVKLVCHTILV